MKNFKSFNESINKMDQYKKITIPYLEKYYELPVDKEGNNIVKERQRRFLQRIYGRLVEFKTTWDEKVSGVVNNVQFNIYPIFGKIRRITCKIYFKDGRNYNAKQGSLMKMSLNIDNNHIDVDPYGEEIWESNKVDFVDLHEGDRVIVIKKGKNYNRIGTITYFEKESWHGNIYYHIEITLDYDEKRIGNVQPIDLIKLDTERRITEKDPYGEEAWEN